ncbi:MAG: SDR family NAD(P)-dependent oxidoreductase [Anaerolineae bacterium]|jgi:NAD(P)-dependent dehydrogenase (short-subunit alcohol dehydrogenase family)
MIMDAFSLEGQVGIVTGGGQGLGQEFCQAFAEAGADVVVAEQNPATGPVTVDRIEARGRRGLFVETDVTSKASVVAMVEQTLEAFGRIDFLMNNAGITKWSPAEEVSEQDWREVMAVNLDGLFYCCQAVHGPMKDAGGGRIINIASMSGLIVNDPQKQVSYNTSKAAVIHLTRSLACEWAPDSIRVNAIAPGYMATPMAQPFFDDPAYGGRWMQAIPMGRPGQPEELAGAAVYLASHASSYVTGSVLVVDGGYTAW